MAAHRRPGLEKARLSEREREKHPWTRLYSPRLPKTWLRIPRILYSRPAGARSRVRDAIDGRTWLDEHWDDPVPTPEEKAGFAHRHEITTKQVRKSMFIR